MRVLLRRVQHVGVRVDGAIIGNIQQGFLLLVGITSSNTGDIMRKTVRRCAQLRVLEDKNGKMNRGFQDVDGSVLSISQFTLYTSCRRRRCPRSGKAARRDFAQPIYRAFNEELRTYGVHVKTGIFGADMKMDLLNDDPVTILLDSEEW